MTIKEIKDHAGNLDKRSVWVTLRHAINGTDNYRLIAIGDKYVRLMTGGGRRLVGVAADMVIEVRS